MYEQVAVRSERTEHVTAPATLRRALDFIDKHAAVDIDVRDIAAEARLSVRGLQYLFQRHQRCTPCSTCDASASNGLAPTFATPTPLAVTRSLR